MTGERSLHDQFSAWLRKQGLPFAHSRMDDATSQQCGDPDYAVYRNGRVAFIEFKHGKGKLSPAQEKRCDELAAAGCTVRVCRELEPAVRHVQCVFGLDAATEAPAKPNGQSEPRPDEQKFYVAGSRQCGDLVICRNADGHWGALRIASNLDRQNLPRFNGNWEG